MDNISHVLKAVKNKEAATLPEQVAEQLSQWIIEQHLTSKDRLPNEFALAQQLNVGRGTVREAVKLLVARNVLVIRRGRGTYIAEHVGEIADPLGFAYYPNQLQFAFDLLEVRMQIEPWVACQAAQRRTEKELYRLKQNCFLVETEILADRNHLSQDVEYHVSIAECMHNLAVPKLIPIITYAVSLFGTLTDRSLRKETMTEHRLIAEAIANHDGEKAAAVMQQHIENNRLAMLSIRRELEEDIPEHELDWDGQ